MDDLPSRTAMGSAVLRAAHVHEDAPPWLLEDRLSEQPLDSRSLAEVRAEIAQWSPDVRAYTRSEVAGLLGGVGFSSVTLLDAAALKGRYFPDRRDLRLPDSTVVCVARR